MPNPAKPIALSAALLVGIVVAANADSPGHVGNNATEPTATGPGGSLQPPGPQIAAIPPSGAAAARSSVVLPEVTVRAPETYPQPYSTGGGPRVSSYSKPRSEHYAVPPDYAANLALHPYTSRLGPRASSHGTVRAQHYEVPPGYDDNLAMHPYTSGLGPCLQGGTGKVVCTDMIPASHHNHNH